MTLRKLYQAQTPPITPLGLANSNQADYKTIQGQIIGKGMKYQPQNEEVPPKFCYLNLADGSKQSQAAIQPSRYLPRPNQKELWLDKNCDGELKFSFNREWDNTQSYYRFCQNQQVKINPASLLKDQKIEHQRQGYSKQMPLTVQQKPSLPDLNPLQEVHNTFHSRKTSVGSIKRNRKEKQPDHKEIKQQYSISHSALDDIQNIRMSKLKQMNEKLNKVLNKENICKLTPYANIQPCQSSNSQLIKPSANEQAKEDLFIETNLQQKQSSSKINSNEIVRYLDRLFDYLDGNKVGMLSRSNCQAATIPQELKFVFGGIFTKIIFKNLRCNKREFTKLCLNALKEVDTSQIIDLLQNIHSAKDTNSNTSIKGMLRQQAQSQQQQIYLSGSILQPDTRQQSSESADYYIRGTDRLQTNLRIRYHEIEQPPLAAQIAKEIDLQPIQTKLYPSKRQGCIPFQAPSSDYFNQKRKSGTISQSVLMQHRKGLQQLNELDSMMSKILKTKHLGDHMGQKSQSDSLQFSQLVKHI